LSMAGPVPGPSTRDSPRLVTKDKSWRTYARWCVGDVLYRIRACTASELSDVCQLCMCNQRSMCVRVCCVRVYACACVRAYMHACVRVCLRAYICACVRACLLVRQDGQQLGVLGVDTAGHVGIGHWYTQGSAIKNAEIIYLYMNMYTKRYYILYIYILYT
jgi:hypothetical protein